MDTIQKLDRRVETKNVWAKVLVLQLLTKLLRLLILQNSSCNNNHSQVGLEQNN